MSAVLVIEKKSAITKVASCEIYEDCLPHIKIADIL